MCAQRKTIKKTLRKLRVYRGLFIDSLSSSLENDIVASSSSSSGTLVKFIRVNDGGFLFGRGALSLPWRVQWVCIYYCARAHTHLNCLVIASAPELFIIALCASCLSLNSPPFSRLGASTVEYVMCNCACSKGLRMKLLYIEILCFTSKNFYIFFHLFIIWIEST